MADLARSIGNPMASKTCDALTEPTMQAEPLDAQIAFQIQRHQHRFRINADETYVERVGKPMSLVAILLRIREKRLRCVSTNHHAIALCVPVRVSRSRNIHSAAAAIPAMPGDVFCPGAPLIFVRAAEHDWLNRQTAPQDKEILFPLVRKICAQQNCATSTRRDIDIQFSRTPGPCRCEATRRGLGISARFRASAGSRRFRCSQS